MDKVKHDFYMPREPTRFSPPELDNVLQHCENLNASDITIQSALIKEPMLTNVKLDTTMPQFSILENVEEVFIRVISEINL